MTALRYFALGLLSAWGFVVGFLVLSWFIGGLRGWWRRRQEWKRIEREAQALIDRGGT